MSWRHDGPRVFYVMGPSGVGKDGLINATRDRLGESALVHFARRFITRPETGDRENHIPLNHAEFDARLNNREFLFHWHSHGAAYGISRRVESYLARGEHVVVNGSRGYLEQARQRCPALLPVLTICTDEAMLRERLQRRGRESAVEIEQRILHSRRFQATRPVGAVTIDNSGDLESAVDVFCRLLMETAHATRFNPA